MTAGRITEEGEAVLPIAVQAGTQARGGEPPQARFEAVIDTGFNGALTLPFGQIQQLALPSVGTDQVQLGDGSLVDVRLFRAVVVFDERPRDVLVEAAPTVPLVGTSLLWGWGLHVDFEADGRVEVEPLP